MADAAIQNDTLPATRKKPMFPIGDGLRGYLRTFRRERDIPVTYERLRGFTEAIPLVDADGKPTLWDTVIYDRTEMRALNEALKEVYALIKVDGDKSVVQHLYADRVDFCTFGNSMPFRIRIVNAYNDNQAATAPGWWRWRFWSPPKSPTARSKCSPARKTCWRLCCAASP